MKISLTGLDRRLLKMMHRIASLADQRGICLYLVGGFVRDIILRKRNFDLDFVVIGDAIDFARQVARRYRAQVVVHPRFNTATLKFPGGLTVDLAMARAEDYPHSGALPVVKPGTIHDDLFRRDFTINALAISVNKKTFGTLVDIYNGKSDLQNKKIRILHDKSFRDDPTRILRAVRFEQRFGFSFETLTRAALRAALQRRILRHITAQRFFHELRKIFKEPEPGKYIRRLDHLKILGQFFRNFHPDFNLLRRVERNIMRLNGQGPYQNRDWSFIYLMALAQTMTTAQSTGLLTKFDLTRRDKESLQALGCVSEIVKTLNRKTFKASLVYTLLKGLPLDLVYYLRVYSSSKIVARRLDWFLEKGRFIQLTLNGHVLKKMGIACDQSMGMVLEELIKRKVDGRFLSLRDEIKCAQGLALKSRNKKG